MDSGTRASSVGARYYSGGGGGSSQKRRKVDAVIEVLDAAKTEFDEREQALEERERALQKALDGVSSEKQLMAGRKPSDVLPLNIGGVKTHASRRTLCLHEPSLLAAQFSGRWDDNIEKDADASSWTSRTSSSNHC